MQVLSLPGHVAEKINFAAGNGCWEWTASLCLAHRVVYEALVGPIPAGRELDHLCRNRRCVNPVHLDPVVHRTNVLRGEGVTAVNAVKTHCSRGHELTADNTRIYDGARKCLACGPINLAAHKERLAALEARIAERRAARAYRKAS